MSGRARKRIKRRIACEFFTADQKYSGIVIDVSSGGLFVRTTAPIKVGTVLEVHLAESTNAPAMKLRAEVMRRRTAPPMLSASVPAGLGLKILSAPVEFGLLVDKKLLSAPICVERKGVGPGAGCTKPSSIETDAQSAEGEGGSSEASKSPAPSRTKNTPSRPRPEAPVPKPAKTPTSVARSRSAYTAPAAAEKAHGPEASEAVLIGGSELDEIAVVLDGVGIKGVRCAADAASLRDLKPRRLMIVAASAAISLGILVSGKSTVGIAVADDISDRLRKLLQQLGFQYLVRRPLDPDALRLLFHHVFYEAHEKRQAHRNPMGCEVSWRVRWRRHRGVLLDISMGGCRLVSDDKMSLGSMLAIKIPREVTGGQSLKIQGSVIRSTPHVSVSGSRSHAAAIKWEKTPGQTQAQLAEFCDRWSKEMPKASREVSAPGTDEAAARDEVEAVPKDRRHVARGAVEKNISQVDDQLREIQTLFCRDLSVGGVRVDPTPDLRLGDRLQLTLHDERSTDPLLVDALVSRDDGELGWGLEFDAPSSEVMARIERLVVALPPVEALVGDEGSLGNVLARIISKNSAD